MTRHARLRASSRSNHSMSLQFFPRLAEKNSRYGMPMAEADVRAFGVGYVVLVQEEAEFGLCR